jgi:hypothetical protein
MIEMIVIHRYRRWIMRFDLNDEEWALLEPLMREYPRRTGYVTIT